MKKKKLQQTQPAERKVLMRNWYTDRAKLKKNMEYGFVICGIYTNLEDTDDKLIDK